MEPLAFTLACVYTAIYWFGIGAMIKEEGWPLRNTVG